MNDALSWRLSLGSAVPMVCEQREEKKIHRKRCLPCNVYFSLALCQFSLHRSTLPPLRDKLSRKMERQVAFGRISSTNRESKMEPRGMKPVFLRSENEWIKEEKKQNKHTHMLKFQRAFPGSLFPSFRSCNWFIFLPLVSTRLIDRWWKHCVAALRRGKTVVRKACKKFSLRKRTLFYSKVKICKDCKGLIELYHM